MRIIREKYHSNRKKQKKSCPDRRPHLGKYTYHGWTSWKELEPEKSERPPEAFYYPGRDKNPTTWSKQTAHNIIDIYAAVCWGLGSTTHEEMSRNTSLFIKLYKKQKGHCPITGMRLYGGPGLKQLGIGIDLISAKRGIQKGNVRLISLPLALTRTMIQSQPTYGKLCPNDYKKYPISWVIFKTLQKTLKTRNLFAHIPINFIWHPPNSTAKGYNPISTSRPHSIEASFPCITSTLSHNSLCDGKYINYLFGRVTMGEERLKFLDKQETYLALTEPTDIIEYIIKYFKRRFVEKYKEIFEGY